MRAPVVGACAADHRVGVGARRLSRARTTGARARRALPADQQRAPVRFEVASEGAGALRLYVEQRGISLTAIASGLVPGTAVTARSPIERFGVVTFLAPAQVSRPVAVSIRSRDSPEIRGEVCFSADRISPATSNACGPSEHLQTRA